MYKKITLLLLLINLFIDISAAQGTKSSGGDLRGAELIEVNRTYSYNASPIGYGKIKEFKPSNSKFSYFFKEERNTRWFLIKIPANGILVFELTPHSLRDDYDWMLYNFSADLEASINKGTAKPVRTNNARNDKKGGSKTGIKAGFNNEYAPPGPGNNFSKPLTVKKGDQLALVVDNVYRGGLGFDLRINLQPDLKGPVIKPAPNAPLVILEGFVRDKKRKKPLAANIVIEDDSTGLVLGKTTSDAITGKYQLKIPANKALNVTAYHPAYLFKTEDWIAKSVGINKLDFILDTITAGNKIILTNIHFLANKDVIMPNSKPELERLLLFLKTHSEWRVKLIGHTNNNIYANESYLQKLSFNRAIKVKQFLLTNKIEEYRLSCAGLGGTSPLITTNDIKEGLRNSRVEVVLTGR